MRRDLAQVADACRRDQRPRDGLPARDALRHLPLLRSGARGEHLHERRRHPRDPWIAESARDRRVHRHLVVAQRKGDTVAAPLLAHVAQRVLTTAPVELVQYDERGEVEHVDLLELARGAVLGRHHVEREIDEVDDLRVALADACGLDDHDPEPLCPQERHGRPEGRARGDVLAAGGEGAHERPLAAQAVHPDPVAEECAAGAPAGRVDRDDGDRELGEPLEQAREDLVRDRALAGAAGAGDADDRGARSRRLPRGQALVERVADEHAVLERGQHLRDREVVLVDLCRRVCQHRRGDTPALVRGARDEIVDHALEAELEAVVRVVDPLHAQRLELRDLGRRDRAAATAEHADAAGAALAQHLDHVAEVLDVPALVRAHRDRVRVLLDRGPDDLGDSPVVPEVDHLRPTRLDEPAHDVDRRVVAVEQRGRRDDAERGDPDLEARLAGLDRDARHATPSSRKVRTSFNISRAITILWISWVPS